LKRALDVVAAAAGLATTWPVLIAAAVAIKVDSPGPALYRGLRVGKDGRQFRIVKFRTMVAGADRIGPPLTGRGDMRVTRVGRLLRRFKLDELPQLLNVLRGEMSLVGPRPEHPHFVSLYSPEQRRVLDVRPGLTGPSSVAYAHEETLLEGAGSEDVYVRRVMPSKLAIDLRYIEERTLATDLWILARTMVAVVRRPSSRPGASRPGVAG
jgi:lipopolysaccharide/colanic/teichoic acid biosynthesis glycosyltransferase